MEMQQIRYFLAAAQELNFTRAAAKCNVSQPSLTRAIGLLETELGGDLFRRERNLTHLTELGKRMLPLLTKTIEHADQAARLAKSIGSGKLVSLRLALPEGMSLEPFVPHLLELAKAFPDFDFKVQRGSLASLTECLREGEIDLLFGHRLENGWERFEYWPLYQRSFGLVFRADHPLARLDVIRPEDLREVRVLHRRYCGVSNEVWGQVQAAGVPVLSGIEFTRDEDLLAYMSSGTPYVTLLPDCLLPREALTSRKLAGPDLGYRVHAITVCGRQRGAALSLFITQLRAADWHMVAA